MSSIKTSELNALAQAARGDLLLITDISASASRKITFRSLVVQAYADIKLLAASAAQALSTTDTKITVFDGTTGSFNFQVAADHDSVQVEEDGIYQVSLSLNGYLDAAKTVSFKLSINGVVDADSQIISAIPSGAANAISASFCVLKSLAVDDIVTLEAAVSSGTANITYNNIDLVIRKIDSIA